MTDNNERLLTARPVPCVHCTLHCTAVQVYYEDLDNGDRIEAYCNLVHCYSLPHDEGLWVEHGYFDDR